MNNSTHKTEYVLQMQGKVVGSEKHFHYLTAVEEAKRLLSMSNAGQSVTIFKSVGIVQPVQPKFKVEGIDPSDYAMYNHQESKDSSLKVGDKVVIANNNTYPVKHHLQPGSVAEIIYIRASHYELKGYTADGRTISQGLCRGQFYII